MLALMGNRTPQPVPMGIPVSKPCFLPPAPQKHPSTLLILTSLISWTSISKSQGDKGHPTQSRTHEAPSWSCQKYLAFILTHSYHPRTGRKPCFQKDKELRGTWGLSFLKWSESCSECLLLRWVTLRGPPVTCQSPRPAIRSHIQGKTKPS